MESRSILSIPDEIVETELISHCDAGDVIALAQTCKHYLGLFQVSAQSLLQRLHEHIEAAELKPVAGILSQHPRLLMIKWQGLTALQRAWLESDKPLYDMMHSYLPANQAIFQIAELHKNNMDEQYNFQPLIDAYRTYLDFSTTAPDPDNEVSASRKQFLFMAIGKQQKVMPLNLFLGYFHPAKIFLENGVRRYRFCEGLVSDLRSKPLGLCFVVVRGGDSGATLENKVRVNRWIENDLTALIKLDEERKAWKAAVLAELPAPTKTMAYSNAR